MPCTDFFRLKVVRLEEQLARVNAFSSNQVGLVSGIQLKGLKLVTLPRLV